MRRFKIHRVPSAHDQKVAAIFFGSKQYDLTQFLLIKKYFLEKSRAYFNETQQLCKKL